MGYADQQALAICARGIKHRSHPDIQESIFDGQRLERLPRELFKNLHPKAGQRRLAKLLI